MSVSRIDATYFCLRQRVHAIMLLGALLVGSRTYADDSASLPSSIPSILGLVYEVSGPGLLASIDRLTILSLSLDRSINASLSLSRPSMRSGSLEGPGAGAQGGCQLDEPAVGGGGKRGYAPPPWAEGVGGGRTGRAGDKLSRDAEAGDAERRRLCGLVFISISVLIARGLTDPLLRCTRGPVR